ncbi:regulator of G-protein signaling 9 [Salvelinus sp. IW2-2015]|uniref:regulator of G-protein signaling 9 n=1 Tax=Salvelinus sp. IW2-2015 TaxID=2691554 RepID=UPI0038D40BD2
MEVTVKGLKHPHRYVLDAADTHLHADEEGLFRRYLKSLVFKDTQKRAICPDQHMFSVSQLEANARKRRPSISTIIARQLEQEERARMATRGPVDITQVMSKLSNKGKEVPPSKK